IRPNSPLQSPYTIFPDGVGRTCPLSQPGDGTHSCRGSSGPHAVGGRLGTARFFPVSCCGPYTRYGNCSSVSTMYISAVGWLFCVDQLAPPSCVMFAPPSLVSISIFGLSGLNHMTWWSPCGALTLVKVFPPSVDLWYPSSVTWTSFSSFGFTKTL